MVRLLRYPHENNHGCQKFWHFIDLFRVSICYISWNVNGCFNRQRIWCMNFRWHIFYVTNFSFLNSSSLCKYLSTLLMFNNHSRKRTSSPLCHHHLFNMLNNTHHSHTCTVVIIVFFNYNFEISYIISLLPPGFEEHNHMFFTFGWCTQLPRYSI